MKDFILSVAQWPVSRDRDRNLTLARRHILEAGAAARRAALPGLCLLPEMFQTPYELEELARREEAPEGPSLAALREAAREAGVHVVGGSFCEKDGPSRYNSAFVVGADGGVLGRHRKIHLFDVSLPQVTLQESSVLSAGEAPLVLELPFCRLGVAICYDLRFPAIFERFEALGVDVVAIPAAFSRTTGRAHWHLLLRTRAVDHQVYLAAACPAPDEGSTYVAYGHSLIVDPWGDVLAELGEDEASTSIPVSAARLETVRRQLPVLAHRRHDLYRQWREQE